MYMISKQPTSVNDVVPSGVAPPLGGVTDFGIPRGLEYLAQIDQVLIHQAVELVEVFSGWESKNRYEIKNTLGQQIYFAMEESSCLMRQCCKQGRGFTMHITDNNGQEVLRGIHPFRCCQGCCCCADNDYCAMDIIIEAPVGNKIAFFRQRKFYCSPRLELLDAHDRPVFDIQAPCCCRMIQCPCGCTDDVEINILDSKSKERVGVISKQWAGVAKECFTKADNFSIQFPMDLDVKMKAALIAGFFLMEMMLFEYGNNN
ncbi:phospholipid scramblase 1-like [Anneissia japonica]|uniref:phospholipid scramblase 1-like n=1 Tax=Anneissia japonica TaxID=1529436 RepID=UPI001425A7BD|nr:phospholipid scramblase 1-like [Anneissia japonica]